MQRLTASSPIRGFPRGLPVALGGLLLCSLPALAGITSYGVFKGLRFEQVSAAAPTPTESTSHGVYAFVKTEAEDEVLLAQVQATGVLIPSLLFPSERDATLNEAEAEFDSLAELNAAAPNGAVKFTLFDGDFNQFTPTLTLTGDAYPAAAGLLNYAATQQLDPQQPFTLQWTPPATLTANDYFQVSIENDEGPVFETPLPWADGALPGTSSSYTLPAGLLSGAGLRAQLLFIRVTSRDTAGIPGATGLAGYYTSVNIPLKLAGGGGGDTEAPSLVSSAPAMLATGVPTGTSLVLTFSEPMRPEQSVNWINVPNAGAMNYAWDAGGRSLTCTLPGGFPANTQVIWALDPDGFHDLAGNALASGMLGGLFTTAGGGPAPCEGGFNERTNLFFVSREVAYQQTSGGAPTEGGDPVASFGAFFTPGSGMSVSGASVTVPGGAVHPLTGLLGNYFYGASAASAAALEAGYPSGSYTGTVTAGSTGSVVLPSVTAPPVPQCLNFDPAQAIDPASGFMLVWNAFAGATGNDRLEITIEDPAGQTVFHAPDECAQPPVQLASSATSVTLQAGLLQAGKTYQVELRFMKVSDFVGQSAPAFQGAAAYSKVTRFPIRTTGGVPDSVTITAYRLPEDGRFEVDVETAAGRTVTLEAWLGAGAWEPVNGGISDGNGRATLKDQRLQVPASQIYRVRSQ